MFTCSLRHPTPHVVEQHRGVRGMIAAPADVPLLVTGRDSVAYEYPGKANRDSGTYIKTSWGHTDVRHSA